MSKDYKERLRFHRISILKRLIPVSILPLLIIVLLVSVQLLRQAPEKWETDTITLSSIDATTVFARNGSNTVARITDTNKRSFVVSQMKPTEAVDTLKTGTSYTIAYASEFDRLHIKGLCENNNIIIDKDDSIEIYESNRTVTITVCLICVAIMAILFTVVIKFFCKEERKQIRHLKKKIKCNNTT